MPSLCVGEETWKKSKTSHYKNTIGEGFEVFTPQDFAFYADQLSDEQNFKNHLNTILIPRSNWLNWRYQCVDGFMSK